MKQYDLFSFGNISIDYIKTPSSLTEMTGGAVLYAVWVAHQLGYKVGICTKIASKDQFRLKEFPIPTNDITAKDSKETTSIFNDYLTADMERRVCTNKGQADPFQINDFPEFKAKAIQYSGLLVGEINLEIIRFLSKKGPLAIDAQGLTRKVMPNRAMEFQNWDYMQEAMPFIHYFKADAAEAEFLTGIKTEDHEGRVTAGKKFIEMGAKEIVISHNKELIAVTKDEVVFAPFKNRNLSGRTGRGDTCFTTYITERFSQKPCVAVKFAAALTSLKMEVPGPFKQTRKDVENFLAQFYK